MPTGSHTRAHGAPLGAEHSGVVCCPAPYLLVLHGLSGPRELRPPQTGSSKVKAVSRSPGGWGRNRKPGQGLLAGTALPLDWCPAGGQPPWQGQECTSGPPSGRTSRSTAARVQEGESLGARGAEAAPWSTAPLSQGCVGPACLPGWAARGQGGAQLPAPARHLLCGQALVHVCFFLTSTCALSSWAEACAGGGREEASLTGTVLPQSLPHFSLLSIAFRCARCGFQVSVPRPTLCDRSWEIQSLFGLPGWLFFFSFIL